jgi:hypothetical protein
VSSNASLADLCRELSDATEVDDGFRQEAAAKAIKSLRDPKGIPALSAAFETKANIYVSHLSPRASAYPAFALLDALFSLGWQPPDSATKVKVERVIKLYRDEYDSPEMVRMADQLERSLNPAFAPSSSPAVQPRPGVLDLRSTSDREIEELATRPLEGDLESIAETVGRLGHEYQDMGDAKWQQMQAIGRQLHERGGLRLMQLVCNRARALGGRASSVSASWRGIGEWRH